MALWTQEGRRLGPQRSGQWLLPGREKGRTQDKGESILPPKKITSQATGG